MKLKNVIFMLGMWCVWFALTSCDEDETVQFPRYYILGHSAVAPEEVGKYSLGNHKGDFAWSTSDAAIAEVISSSGSDAEVEFLHSGEVRLSVTDGEKEGYIDITVVEGEAGAIEVTYSRSGVVSEAVEDTIFFLFDAPLASIPKIIFNGALASDTSAFFTDEDDKAIAPFYSPGQVISDLKRYHPDSLKLYYALYQGGSGNGQPEAMFESVELAENHGGDEIENFYFKLPKVDNIAPVGSVELSKTFAKEGDEIAITVSFNEVMRPKLNTYADSLVFVNISGGSVSAITDTLWATANPLVWTLDYTVDGSGDGTMTIEIDDIVDLGGNSPVSLVTGSLTIDNTAPLASGTATVLPNSQAISIETDGYWLVLTSGSEAPTKLDDFNAGGYGDDLVVVEAGIYDIYYLAVDKAGNESVIISESGIEVTE